MFSSPAVVNGIVYIGSFDGKVYALGNWASLFQTSIPTPTPTPQATATPTTTPTPTLTPTAILVLANTSKPIATPIITQMPQLSPTPIQDPIPIATSEPKGELMLGVTQNESDFTSWIILGGIIGTAVVALIFFMLVFRRRP